MDTEETQNLKSSLINQVSLVFSQKKIKYYFFLIQCRAQIKQS
jgi:hypothetical protein